MSLPAQSDQLLPKLRAGCAALDLTLTNAQLERLNVYLGLLLQQRGRVNLTAIRDPAEAERVLLLESIAAVVAVPGLRAPAGGSAQTRLLDLGAGGGIPGIPLALAFPHVDVTLLDATRKKVEFLQHAARELDLANVSALWGRAEPLAHAPAHRAQYDFVTARGIGNLATVVELALPFCALGGTAAVFKSLPIDDELEAAVPALEVLGGEPPRVTPFDLPALPARHGVVTVRKRSSTPDAYPRRVGVPAKRPLGEK